MQCSEDGEKELGGEGWDGEKVDRTARRSENGERKDAVREVRCSGLSFGCRCTVSLEVLA